MQTNLRIDGNAPVDAESFILAELESAPVAEATLKNRVRAHVRGIKEKEYKAILKRLTDARKIHGRAKLGRNGKPTATMESYALGAPPPPPPPPLPPAELAPPEILKALQSGPVAANTLKERVKQHVPKLSAKDYNAALAALVAEKKIHGRAKLGKNGKPTKTLESYACGPAPINLELLLAPVVKSWKKAHADALAAGADERAIVTALLEKLNLTEYVASGEQAKPVPREEVLRRVRELVAREGRGALIPIRRLRATTRLAKSEFDAAVLQLHGDDAIILHHHDYVGSLSEAELAELVVDQYGNHYVGIALRGES
jgi:hypothetical protein